MRCFTIFDGSIVGLNFTTLLFFAQYLLFEVGIELTLSKYQFELKRCAILFKHEMYISIYFHISLFFFVIFLLKRRSFERPFFCLCKNKEQSGFKLLLLK